MTTRTASHQTRSMRTSHLAPLFAVAAALAGCRAQVIDDGSTGSTDTHTDSGTNGATGSGGPVRVAYTELIPKVLASDGTTLFWSSVGNPLESTPVMGGGSVTILDPDSIGQGLLTFDDTNVYYIKDGRVANMPKTGGTIAYNTDATVEQATVLGSTLYWVETPSSGDNVGLLESAPLQGGTPTVIVQFDDFLLSALGVNATTAFLSLPEMLLAVPLTGDAPEGGTMIPDTPASNCYGFISGTDTVYCMAQAVPMTGVPLGGSIIAIASDGSATTLAPVSGITLENGGIAIDDTFVYWVDNANDGPLNDGSIMRVPKSGGTVTTVVKATLPVAVAVDANAVYWSDQLGNIWRLAK
jgi:hypothetical protein